LGVSLGSDVAGIVVTHQSMYRYMSLIFLEKRLEICLV